MASGVLAKVSSTVSQSPIVHQSKILAVSTGIVLKKLLRSTAKAAWFAGTSIVILALPLIMETEREQQLVQLELEHGSMLGTPTVK